MNRKNLITLGVAFGILALVIAAWAIIASVSSDAPDDTLSAETEDLTVTDLNSDEILGFSVSSADSTLSFLCKYQCWLLENNEKYPLNQSAVSSLFSKVGSLVAKRKLNAGELDDSVTGLSSPTVTFTLTLTDETVAVYDIGNSNVLLSARYLTRRGSSDVYLVDASLISDLSVSLLSLTQLPTVPDATVVRKITVRNGDSVTVTDADDGRFSAFSALELLDVAAYETDDTARAAYGLDVEHRTAVTVDYSVTTEVESSENSPYVRFDTEENVTLYFGNTVSSTPTYRYAQIRLSSDETEPALICLVRSDIAALLIDGTEP